MSKFQGSLDRIKRAVIHGKAYTSAANELFHDNPPSIAFKFNHNGASEGEGIAYATFKRPFDSYLALELGEFFYQLRSSLDCAYWTAVNIVGIPVGVKETSIEFPIYDASRFKTCSLHKIPFPNELHTFIEGIQPDNITKHDITSPESGFLTCVKLIHDCARFDRHRHLSVMAAFPRGGGWRFQIQAPLWHFLRQRTSG